MIFPTIQLPDIVDPAKKPVREKWLRETAERTLAWLDLEEPVDAWMTPFREVRRRILRAAWECALTPELRAGVAYLLLGSASRGEDLIYSDLDHALLLFEEANRAAVAPRVRAFTRIMYECGCPPCDGFISSANPRWSGTLAEWEERIAQYFAYPDWTNARFLFMLTDAQPLQEGPSEWEVLRQRVLDGIRTSPFLCWQMAHLGIDQTVALSKLGRVRLVKSERPREIVNIKEGLINPILHALRLHAVANGFMEISTRQRHAWLSERGILPSELSPRIGRALEFGWRVRLAHQTRLLLAVKPVTDHLDIGVMSASEREALLTHLETAKQLERWTHRTFRKPKGT